MTLKQLIEYADRIGVVSYDAVILADDSGDPLVVGETEQQLHDRWIYLIPRDREEPKSPRWQRRVD